MFDKLDTIEEKYEALTQQLGDPETLADQSKYAKIAKQHRDLEEMVAKYREFKALDRGLSDTREMLALEDDAEMLALARAVMAELEARREKIEAELKVLL